MNSRIVFVPLTALPVARCWQRYSAYQKNTESKCFQPFPGIIPGHGMTDAQQSITAYIHHVNPNTAAELVINKPVVLYGKGWALGRVITNSRTERIGDNVAT